MNRPSTVATAAATPATPAQRDAIAAASASPRFAPYRYVHKGLRVLMFSTLHRAGALDASQAEDRAQIVEDVERLLATCADHLAHENQFFHEPLRKRAPRAVLPFHEDHLEHLDAIHALGKLLLRLRDAPDARAPALAYELFLRLSVFIGENLEHMAEEEGALTQALWEHFSDGEIAAMESALQATLAPHETAFYLSWMAQGMNASEAIVVLSSARPTMPAELFAQLAATVQAAMPAKRWAVVARALGVPAARGLF